MKLKQIFFEKKGKPSLKRISGSMMLLNGIAGKNLLAAAGVFKEIPQYTKIDATFDSLIMGGVILLFGTIADKFVKK